MTQEHPITPSSELVEKWYEAIDNSSTSWKQELATQAARWGADMELKACCALMDDWGLDDADLHFARRPKPPSLKEQSIALIDKIQGNKEMWQTDDLDVVRRALESLPD